MDPFPYPWQSTEAYLESCYRALVRGKPLPELGGELASQLDAESRRHLDDAVARLEQRARARRHGRPARLRPRPDRSRSPGPELRSASVTSTAGAITPHRDWPRIRGYTIKGLIGEGGFGRVYRAASEQHFGVDVALKVLRPERIDEPGIGQPEHRRLLAQLLVDEARVLAHIGHRNVVRYFGSGFVAEGSEAGTPYVATELIEGQALADRIGQDPQDPKWSAAVLVKVADALDFVHQIKLHGLSSAGEHAADTGLCIAMSSPPTFCSVPTTSRS